MLIHPRPGRTTPHDPHRPHHRTVSTASTAPLHPTAHHREVTEMQRRILIPKAAL